LACDGHARKLEMRFSLSWTPVIVRAVLHKEFVRPKPDKLLAVQAVILRQQLVAALAEVGVLGDAI
jgi:hypothetical protein